MNTPVIPRLTLLGAEIDVVTPAQMLDFVASAIRRGEKVVVSNHNLHSLYLYRKRQDMRAFYAQAALIEIDSVPLIMWGRLMGHDVSRAHRVTYLDYRETFWTMAAQKGWRVYHLGGAHEHNEPARQAILQRHPEVTLKVHHGFFDVKGPHNESVLKDIADFKPDVLLVGMGMPRQELWISDNLQRLPACAILNVGAAFDYEAGAQYAPPRWVGRAGLEWLVRLMSDPVRLFSRYCLEPWVLIPAALSDVKRRLSPR
jgi:N-acetylglucosaminyldiphosphoundecaprenol N-acetyl-beta-D-mannosaminyltransferase